MDKGKSDDDILVHVLLLNAWTFVYESRVLVWNIVSEQRFAKMATIIGDPKRHVSLNTAIRRQASLSECLTQATLTQARLNLAS